MYAGTSIPSAHDEDASYLSEVSDHLSDTSDIENNIPARNFNAIRQMFNKPEETTPRREGAKRPCPSPGQSPVTETKKIRDDNSYTHDQQIQMLVRKIEEMQETHAVLMEQLKELRVEIKQKDEENRKLVAQLVRLTEIKYQESEAARCQQTKPRIRKKSDQDRRKTKKRTNQDHREDKKRNNQVNREDKNNKPRKTQKEVRRRSPRSLQPHKWRRRKDQCDTCTGHSVGIKIDEQFQQHW
ncbi:unnamed protein product [Diabrotica balteata]|uniref:Uncharacterized protein n=1 Tax=Diabrotica balteata TaxID=107213 RepID=A0A9N9TDN6_DIABA|nr:unnamed protein product [Diabrotica balteata]